jgi:hypothetical protein
MTSFSDFDSVAKSLEKLAELKEKGILTQEEFDTKKKSLLAHNNDLALISETAPAIASTKTTAISLSAASGYGKTHKFTGWTVALAPVLYYLFQISMSWLATHGFVGVETAKGFWSYGYSGVFWFSLIYADYFECKKLGMNWKSVGFYFLTYPTYLYKRAKILHLNMTLVWVSLVCTILTMVTTASGLDEWLSRQLSSVQNQVNTVSMPASQLSDSKLKATLSDFQSNAAQAWLKAHPDVKACLENKIRRGEGDHAFEDISGELAFQCHLQLSKGNMKLMGDIPDPEPNATPNGASELENKRLGKAWQDNNGFVHFPDGSRTSSTAD